MNSTKERPPQQEALEQLAEMSPLYLVPRLIATEDQRLSLAAYRRRIHDSHRQAAELQGLTVSESVEDEEMGDISVANHYHYGPPVAPTAPAAKEPAVIAPAKPSKPRLTQEQLQAYIEQKVARKVAEALAKQPAQVNTPPAVKQQTTDAPPTDPADPWYKRYAIPLAIAAGTLGTGGAGLATYNYFSKPAEVQEQTGYGFKISSQPGHGISAE